MRPACVCRVTWMVVAENYGWGEEVQVCLGGSRNSQQELWKISFLWSFWKQEVCQRRGISGESGSVSLERGRLYKNFGCTTKHIMFLFFFFSRHVWWKMKMKMIHRRKLSLSFTNLHLVLVQSRMALMLLALLEFLPASFVLAITKLCNLRKKENEGNCSASCSVNDRIHQILLHW
jgi:hypothetical protein